VRWWLQLRSCLLPYIEFCCKQAAKSGIPVQRAMAHAFPCDRAARDFETQYMLGDSLLIAPVVRAGGNIDAYLPVEENGGGAQSWYDYWTGAKLAAGQIVRYRDLPWDRIPVFVRGGTCVPHTRAHERAQQWEGEIEITELAVCGEPDFERCVTKHFLRKDAARGWRPAGEVGLVKRID